MSRNAMSLKAKIKNYAKVTKLPAQVVLQNYMFECFLNRLSSSKYQEKFVIKGGVLIASIVGLDTRATMDLDTTIRNLPLTEEKIIDALNEVCNIDKSDSIIFEIKGIESIRKDDIYGGYTVKLIAIYDTINTPLNIDISTGDVITPSPIQYELVGLFDESLSIRLWGYNIETVLAEKVETILSRGVFTTRPKDFYDIYILCTTQQFSKKLFQDALVATATHRGTLERISRTDDIINDISKNKELINNWVKYQKQFDYAKTISYESIIEMIKMLLRNYK
ncbi:MAG: abortive phage infection protein [Epulopiscium sp. Nele67-Bin004]|nr:MAG: abortive phage infection protein [Epulopiscium sp. Nele67-Bin004]